jgi:hypothetical protein
MFHQMPRLGLLLVLSRTGHSRSADYIFSELRRLGSGEVSDDLIRVSVCSALAGTSVEFAKIGTYDMHEYLFDSSPENLASATSLAQVDVLCEETPRFPPRLKHAILRHKILDHFKPWITTSPRAMGRLSDSSGLSIVELLTGKVIDRKGISDFFHYRVFIGQQPGICTPFLFKEARWIFALSDIAECTDEEYLWLGRSFALALYLDVPISKSTNSEFMSIMLGKRSGWTMAELERDDPYNHSVLRRLLRDSGRTDPTQGEIDLHVYGLMKKQYDTIAQGFNELIPVGLLDRFITPADLYDILSGGGYHVHNELRQFIKIPDRPEMDKMLMTYAERLYAPEAIVKFVTGVHYLPLGRLDGIVPPISVKVVEGAQNQVSVDRSTHTLILPAFSDEKQFIRAMDKALYPSV